MSQGTVLVAAATGFTGGATVEEFLARGRHVRALAHREDARSKRLQELGAEVVFGDFLDLDAPLLEPLRPVILRVGQRPDLVAAGQQLIDCSPASIPRRAGDQNCSLAHG